MTSATRSRSATFASALAASMPVAATSRRAARNAGRSIGCSTPIWPVVPDGVPSARYLRMIGTHAVQRDRRLVEMARIVGSVGVADGDTRAMLHYARRLGRKIYER